MQPFQPLLHPRPHFVSHLKLTVLQMAESDELSPLIQRHVTASAAELRAEALNMRLETLTQIQLQKSELKSDMQEIKADTFTQLQLQKSELQSSIQELKSDMQEMNQRSLRIEAQLHELISRAGAS